MAQRSSRLNFGGTFLAGAVVGAILMWHFQNELPADLAKGLRDPKWYSAIASIVGVCFGIFGYTRWQTKHRHEKIALAALQALPTVDAYLEHIARVNWSVEISAQLFESVYLSDITDWQKELVSDPLAQHFDAAATMLDLLCPNDPATKQIQLVRDLRRKLGFVLTSAVPLLPPGHDYSQPLPAACCRELLKAFGDDLPAHLQQLRDAVQNELRRLALLE